MTRDDYMARWMMGIIVFALLLIGPDPAFAQRSKKVHLDSVISSRNAQLENIQAELKIKQQRLQDLEHKERHHLEKLYAIEEQLSLNNQLITKIERQIADLNRSLEEIELSLDVNKKELARRQKILNERLVWIYKRSNYSPLLSVLSASDFLQGARRLYLFSLLNRYDRNTITELELLHQQIENQKSQILSRRRTITRLKSEKQAQAVIIRQTREQRKRLVKEVRQQKGIQLKVIQNLNEDQKRIAGIIDVLVESKKSIDIEAAKAFRKLKGKLVWPVEGRIIRGFGRIKDEKYATVISNPGIDIKAKVGTPVYASASGEIVYVSWLRGYGSFVIIDHGGAYYSLYAHLDEILVENGLFVTAGETLGSVAEPSTSPVPVLHFELRKAKKQLNPLPWLR